MELERLLVWAVDGLAGVLLGNSSGQGTRPARNPRALLWGQHAGQLSWAGLSLLRDPLSAEIHLRPVMYPASKIGPTFIIRPEPEWT